MSRISLTVDAWIREAQEASQWVEDLEGRIKYTNLAQSSIADSARSKLLEIGVKLDRLESLLRNPPAKPILTDEDLDYRWKMLSDIQLRTRALARSLYASPYINRLGNVPAKDTKECKINVDRYEQGVTKTSDTHDQDQSELLNPLVSNDSSRSQPQIQPFSSCMSMVTLWRACSTVFLFLGLAALLFIVVLLCSTN
ncbi:hypothetical protein L6164_035134 [Bauhinia variegata]|uniref:Uncharacterized protein n=1 Tax=Bauhinia variegata TaxID=167791 RepID=A0ACB9KXN2_BAUVA|nr:hypothetical protein L6164_035134 [Bauhinia variegata]